MQSAQNVLSSGASTSSHDGHLGGKITLLKSDLFILLCLPDPLFKTAQKNTADGNMPELIKALSQLSEVSSQMGDRTGAVLKEAKAFDTKAYFVSGDFTRQLLDACTVPAVRRRVDYPTVHGLDSHRVAMTRFVAEFLADSLKVKMGSGDMPEGYTTGIHRFGEKNAFNLTSRLYCYNDPNNGTYVYFKNDTSTVKDLTTSGSTFSGGSLAIGAVAGLLGGAALTLVLLVSTKREKEIKRRNLTRNK